MTDIDELERLARAAGSGEWTHDGVGRIKGDLIDEVDVAEYIAAANPQAILALTAEFRTLRVDAERYREIRKHPTWYDAAGRRLWGSELDEAFDAVRSIEQGDSDGVYASDLAAARAKEPK